MHMKLLEILKKIRQGHRNEEVGICENIISASGDDPNTRGFGYEAVQMFLEISTHWPNHSGNHQFPIPSNNDFWDPEYQYSLGDLWTWPQGDYRRELLDFCITWLTNRTVKEELLNKLIAVKGIVTGPNRDAPGLGGRGICDLALNRDGSLRARAIQVALRETMGKWPNHSGNSTFPVATWPLCDHFGTTIGPGDEYSSAAIQKSLWRGAYGDLRMDLLDFCINTLQDELK